MITCTRRIQFCAGHRVYGHEGHCKFVHGHNYVAFITVHAEKLDEVGRVIDFSCIKDKVGRWIEEHWDHGFIYWNADTEIDHMLDRVPGTKRFSLALNPTAENMAFYLLHYTCPDVLKGTNCQATKIVLWETENCYAEATI